MECKSSICLSFFWPLLVLKGTYYYYLSNICFFKLFYLCFVGFKGKRFHYWTCFIFFPGGLSKWKKSNLFAYIPQVSYVSSLCPESWGASGQVCLHVSFQKTPVKYGVLIVVRHTSKISHQHLLFFPSGARGFGRLRLSDSFAPVGCWRVRAKESPERAVRGNSR